MTSWNRDFREFFALLNARRVRYLLIGSVASHFHATPRATKDVDVWVDADPRNLDALLRAIHDFGFPTEGISTEDLAAELEKVRRARR